ncbi:MAG TPA: L,D-transpeptidase [Candidatus Kapabacteria bacterium]
MIAACSFTSCTKEKQEEPLPKVTEKPAPAKEEPPSLKYTSFTITGARELQKLIDSVSFDELLLIQKINRLDRAHFRQGYVLMLPSSFSDTSSISPYPSKIASLTEIRKILFVNRRIQAFGIYENGQLVRWGPTSTGKKKTPTPTGLYYTNWKKELTRSTIDNGWELPWNVNIANFEGISLHQFDLPGYPASHSCVRLLKEDAQWIFNWAEEWVLAKGGAQVLIHGCPVVIFDEYDHTVKTPIWKNVSNNPLSANTNTGQLDSIFAVYKDTIIERQHRRESYFQK